MTLEDSVKIKHAKKQTSKLFKKYPLIASQFKLFWEYSVYSALSCCVIESKGLKKYKKVKMSLVPLVQMNYQTLLINHLLVISVLVTYLLQISNAQKLWHVKKMVNGQTQLQVACHWNFSSKMFLVQLYNLYKR